MTSVKLLGSLKKHRFTALNELLPQGYAVVATFPNKSRCEIRVAIRASREELDCLDKYFWNSSSISDRDRRDLHRSLTENDIPTGAIDGLDRSIESDERLSTRAAHKGKKYRSPDTSDTSGIGCLASVLTSILLFIILMQVPVDTEWWSLLGIILSISAGILIYQPFNSSHSLKMQEITNELKIVQNMGPRLLNADFYASTVTGTATTILDSLKELRDLGLATEETTETVSSTLGKYFDSASETDKARSIISSTNKVLKGLSDSEIRSDPDLARVWSDSEEAVEIKIDHLRRQAEYERSLLAISHSLEKEIRLANAKLNAVRYRYSSDE